MAISVMLHTGDFRQDHMADASVSYELIPGETVDALVARITGQHGPYMPAAYEWIELRVIVPAPPREPTEE